MQGLAERDTDRVQGFLLVVSQIRGGGQRALEPDTE